MIIATPNSIVGKTPIHNQRKIPTKPGVPHFFVIEHIVYITITPKPTMGDVAFNLNKIPRKREGGPVRQPGPDLRNGWRVSADAERTHAELFIMNGGGIVKPSRLEEQPVCIEP